MFPFPSTPPGPRSSPEVDASERGKILLLGVGFLIVLAGFVAAPRLSEALFGGDGGGDGSGTPAVAPVEGGGPGGAPPPVEIVPRVDLFPEEEVAEVEANLREALAGQGSIVDGPPVADPDAFRFLLDQVTTNARVMKLLPEAFDRRPEVSRILAEPAAHRGKAVEVLGELISLEKLPYEGPNRLIAELRRGLVRTKEGTLYSFTWPVASSYEPDPVAPGEGWLRLHGLFYKTWRVKEPGGDGTEVPSLHLVLQRTPRAAYAPVEVRDIDPAWMQEVRDDSVGEMLQYHERPLFLLLNMARTLGPEGFEEWARRRQAEAPDLEVWPPRDFTGKYAEILRNPAAHRFRTVSFTGFLAGFQVEERVPPNPGNVEKVGIAFLVGHDYAPAVWLYAPRSFVEMGYRPEDHVRVQGILVQRLAYQPRGAVEAGKPELNQALQLVVMKIEPLPLPESTLARDLLWVILGAMVIFAGMLAWALFQGRREREASEAFRAKRIAKRREVRGRGSEPAAPAGDDAAAAAGGPPPGGGPLPAGGDGPA